MTRARSLALACLAVLGSGCAVGLVPQSMLPPSSNVHAYVQVGLARPDETRPPNPLPNTIPIYRSTAPDRPYRELGTVYVNNTMDKQAMAAGAREVAASLGGDALIDATIVLGGLLATVVAWEDEP